jgi:translation elongation factor EF-1beta
LSFGTPEAIRFGSNFESAEMEAETIGFGFHEINLRVIGR